MCAYKKVCTYGGWTFCKSYFLDSGIRNYGKHKIDDAAFSAYLFYRRWESEHSRLKKNVKCYLVGLERIFQRSCQTRTRWTLWASRQSLLCGYQECGVPAQDGSGTANSPYLDGGRPSRTWVPAPRKSYSIQIYENPYWYFHYFFLFMR